MVGRYAVTMVTARTGSELPRPSPGQETESGDRGSEVKTAHRRGPQNGQHVDRLHTLTCTCTDVVVVQ